MIRTVFQLYILLFFLVIGTSIQAQDVKNIDVNTLPQSEIEKAKTMIKEANLSPEEAANLARQRGASEQQIREMQKRLLEETDTTNNVTDPFKEAAERTVQDDSAEFSSRESDLKKDLSIFGSYLFNSKNLTFEPSANLQTPANYEINIGDQMIINIWGNSQNNYQLSVNPNGQILIPDVGPVYIAGLTYLSAENKIKQRLTQIYADMAGDSPGTFAQINMGQLKAIRINIVGEVTTPGTYTLPATAAAFNALYLSGGPNEIGSFRNIRIIRNNKTVKDVDIYRFLIDADPSDNIQLKDNDVLFVPPVEKRVTITGQFQRNGIFELKESESLQDIIRFAGGYTEDAYQAKVQIHRKTQQLQQIIDVDFNNLATTALMNGDIISNTKVLDRFENRVTISGSVNRPGEYEWTPGMSLHDLIVKADSLAPDAFQNRGLINRENKDLTTTAIPFDVNEIMAGKSNILLQKEDVILIKSHFELKEMQNISVSGEVLAPGEFVWSKNMTLGDAIFLAKGFTEGADSTFIEVARRLSYQEASFLSDQLVHTFTLNMSRNLELKNNDASFKLKPYDQISVRRAPGFRNSGSAIIAGEVVYAGSFAISNKNQRISDLINLAEGITPQAFVEGATLNRYSDELGKEQVAIDLIDILRNPGGQSDLFLRDGDQLYVPEFMQTVKIGGNVQNPFSIAFEEGKNAKFYIDQCGGFSADAHRKKVYVQYANGATAIKKGFIIKTYPEVKAGSQVIVPQKPEKKPGNGQWLAIASVMASLAVSIATVVSLTN
ncbi:SLBB domain-containing protein [Prolixibacteraceae bacterium Z1-6]|uniref:SLBB domain-containing protein n=1 Tax=Draconibacterium aestuarii TaxID=2998507 RepID=A0A9X3J4Q3_9BACT|nr:SLBB domain-containing protein [Prolixibacteraceae bacterium Z1-6]